MNMLELNKVSFSYNGSPALKNVTFAVDAGAFFGVLGPNGSGKSTLLKVVDGLLAPSSGDLFIGGRPVGEYRRREVARRIAMVPQSYSLDFNFTAREVIEMGRYARTGMRGPHRVADELLEKLEIRELADRFFPTLSGGEKQMVVLAQALAQEPELLLLDEPAAHLDVSYQLRLFDMLRELNREGLTVLCVLHDLNLALLYFREIVMLSSGEPAAVGATDDVLNPELIEAVYGVRAYMHRHAGRTFLTFSPRLRATREERIHLVCGGGTGAHLMRGLVDLGFRVSAGVVNTLDTDEVTARELGLPLAAEAPFTNITEEAFTENMALISRADLLVLTDVPVGRGNLKNIEAVVSAAGMGMEVLALSGVRSQEYSGEAGRMLAGLTGVRYFDDETDLIEEIKKRWGD